MNTDIHFNETQWIKLLFLLADTQNWIDDLAKDAFSQLPLSNKKQCFRKTYYLTASTLAHILERHYYKINRHQQAGKFYIPLIEIVQLIRDAAHIPATPLEGLLNFQRTLSSANNIGYDKDANPVKTITILTDSGGKIITAFPGQFK